MNDLISVIIPAYNAEHFIAGAINSVKRQTYPNWEIIVVENGSRDQTTAMCEALAEDYEDGRKNGTVKCGSIRVLHSEKGVSYARNKGMSAAKGEWLTFLDADDTLADDALEKMLNAASAYEDKNPEIVCYGDAEKVVSGEDMKELIIESLSDPTQKCTVHGWLFRKSFLDEKRLLFNPGLSFAEDSVFAINSLINCGIACVMNNSVYQYSVNEASTVNSMKKDAVSGYKCAIEAAASALYDAKIPDEDGRVKGAFGIFSLSQLLVYLVHCEFESGKEKKETIKTLLSEEPFKSARDYADLSLTGGAKKAVFGLMKSGSVTALSVAVSVRRRQNQL